MASCIRKRRHGHPSKTAFLNVSISPLWIASEPSSSSPNFPYRFGPKPSNTLSTRRTARLPQSSKVKLPTRHSGVTNPTLVTYAFSAPSATCTTTLLLGENSMHTLFPLSSLAIPPLRKLGDTIFHRNVSQEHHGISSLTNVFGAQYFITTLRGS